MSGCLGLIIVFVEVGWSRCRKELVSFFWVVVFWWMFFCYGVCVERVESFNVCGCIGCVEFALVGLGLWIVVRGCVCDDALFLVCVL